MSQNCQSKDIPLLFKNQKNKNLNLGNYKILLKKNRKIMIN